MALISQECGEMANIHERQEGVHESHSHFSISQPAMEDRREYLVTVAW